VRILYLVHNYQFSGTYYRAMPMAQQLSRRGHDVTLFAVSNDHSYRPAWIRDGAVRVCTTPNLAFAGTAEGYGLLDTPVRCLLAFSDRYDIVHMFDHKPNATLPGFPARLRGARLVADWGDWWGGPGGINDVPTRRFHTIASIESWWEERSKLWADGVVTISSVLYERALDLGCRPQHTAWIPTGASIDRIQPIPIASARQQLGIPLDRPVVGFIGMGQGDLGIVMQALRELPDVWLMVIGRSRPETKHLAEAYGVGERLWQTGFVPDDQVGLYLSCADVMCLPMEDRAANRGRFPNKLLDYLAAGRPVVASPVGDVTGLFESQEIGLLVDKAGFVEALGTLFAFPQRRAQLGANARHCAETTFAWPHLIDQLERLYQEVCNGG